MKPLISICIPTFNRVKYLTEGLNSIVNQFSDNNTYKKVEIVISDDDSSDNTKEVVMTYLRKYKNIRYFKNTRNIGFAKNQLKVASFAAGDYIWFLSDDDVHKKGSLKSVFQVMQKYDPDIILCNLDLYSKDLQQVIDKNLLRLSQDKFITREKDLFSHLEKKFFLPFDWYIGVYSNTIIKRTVVNRHATKLCQFDGQPNPFPHSSLFYYFPDDYKIYLLSESVIKFRADNQSFGPKDKIQFLIYMYRILNLHYDNICRKNAKNISSKFKILIFLKKTSRAMRLFLLKLINKDIERVLTSLFYKRTT